ncbi:hypothetical protein OPU71_10250 [Niveibacterium sp. 24ML]|uniref:TraM recognition domain-containing protein n=1 Tax=Niveibacterium sp. 24ML TaxID=2985512 RepID=UPI00226E621A|nr:hypothetical protein [Niveibacterium sp. 24ML]MCX9156502.1 hypothetical protein [Niveibacterium sp. 24ML]
MTSLIENALSALAVLIELISQPFKLLFGLFMFVLSLPQRAITSVYKLARRTPLKRLGAQIDARFSDANIEAWFDKRFANAVDPAHRGDVDAVAEQLYPRAQHAWLYEERIPAHVRLPVVVDGRLPNGQLIAEGLAPSLIDTAAVGVAARKAARVGVINAFVMFVALVAACAILFGHLSGSDAHAAVSADQLTGSYWSQSEFDAALADAQKSADRVAFVKALGAKSLVLTVDLLVAAAGGVLFGALVGFAHFRKLLSSSVEARLEPYARLFLDSLRRYHERFDRVQTSRAKYSETIARSNKDESFRFNFGISTGDALFRGGLSCPEPQTVMQLSLSEMGKGGIWFFGDTGQGKTSQLILPLCRQWITAMRDSATGFVKSALWVSDAKAVLWREVSALASDLCMSEFVRVIGIADNEFGVDPLEGVDPPVAADILTGAVDQATGGGKDGSGAQWKLAAADAFLQTAIIARAWEKTSDGVSYMSETSERCYSLAAIYRLVTDVEPYSRMNRAIEAINEAIQQNSGLGGFASLVGPSLENAITYMCIDWRALAAETRTSVLFNVRNALGMLLTHDGLYYNFSSGNPRRLYDVSEAFDKRITLVNLPEGNYGVAARLLNIFINNRIKIEAKRREDCDGKISEKSRLICVFDEAQNLLIKGNLWADSEWSNIARSSGVVGVYSTQHLTAVNMSLGEHAAANMKLNLSNAIVLQTRDPATFEFFKSFVGTAKRYQIRNDGEFESYDAFRRMTGLDAIEEVQVPVRLSEDSTPYVRKSLSAVFDILHVTQPFEFSLGSTSLSLDLDYAPPLIEVNPGQPSGNSSEYRNFMRAAKHRAEDKRSEAQRDASEEPILRPEDFAAAGNRAFCLFQTPNGFRYDFVHVNAPRAGEMQ